jgi:hypothetical protein
MKTLLNFSHPLSVETLAQLHKRLGEFEYRQVRCQFDLNARETLRAQVEAVIPDDIAVCDVVAIVPPSLSGAAFVVGQIFSKCPRRNGLADRIPFVWMTRTEDLPPTFVLGGVE